MIGDIFKTIFEVILDKSKSFGFKTALFISVVGAVFMTDCFFNISYNIYVSNKLSNLERVNKLKPIYINDSIQYSKLKKIETRLLNKKHYLDFLSFQLSKVDLKTKNISKKEYKLREKEGEKFTIRVRSRFWMVFSSNYAFLIIFPILLFLPLMGSEKNTGNLILGWFASLVMLVGLITFISWISFQIPILFKNPIWNYILNAIIHTFFLVLIVNMSKDKKKN